LLRGPATSIPPRHARDLTRPSRRTPSVSGYDAKKP
jgi:hypothetical protein